MSNYSELISYKTYGDRLKYLQEKAINHESPRHMSNKFYKSPMWLHLRDQIIKRDLGCDIGVFGVYIDGPLLVHHIDPLTEQDISQLSSKCLSPENLITVSEMTHNKIHYAKQEENIKERKPGDTKLW